MALGDDRLAALRFWLTTTFLALVFLMGGGSRADIQSLLILRPVSVVTVAVAIILLQPVHIRAHKVLLFLFAATFLLVLGHMVPLPPFIWQELPGREVPVEVGQLARLEGLWRPLSLVPHQSENALFSLFTPLAVILLSIQLDAVARRRLVIPVLALGLISGLLAVIQLSGPPNGAAYLYRITNPGQGVGLFANRNHQAAFIASLLPLIGYLAMSLQTFDRRARRSGLWLAGVSVLFILPLLLITGSRAGLVLGLLAMLVTIGTIAVNDRLLDRITWSTRTKWSAVGSAIGMLAVVASVFIFSKAQSVDRIFPASEEAELRFSIWPVVWRQAMDYFPVGSGVGTFVEVFKLGEPEEMLRDQYVNHVHNDFLEVLLTAGLPGVLLVLAVLLWCAHRMWHAFRNGDGSANKRLARAAATIIIVLTVGSFADYPLRTPAMASLFVLACVWLDTSRSDKTKFPRSDFAAKAQQIG